MSEKRELHRSWEPILKQHRERVPSGEHREAVRESVRAHIEEARSGMATPAQDDTSPTGAATAVSQADASHFKALKEPQQVAYLAKVALEEGIVKAVLLAEKTGSAYVVDALHDLLVDELSQELEARHRDNL